MKIECLKMDRITDDFPQLVDFAGYCGMEEDVVVVAPRKELEAKLKKLKLSPKLHFCKPGEILKRWGVDVAGRCGPEWPNFGLKVEWQIAVEVQDGNDPLVSVLMHELGHYVEQIASDQGCFKGRYAFRGTSFDEACRYISSVGGVSKNELSVRAVADELVANINASWLCWASGIDPIVAAAKMLAVATHPDRGFLRDALEGDAFEFAKATMHPGFYLKHIAEEGWNTERQMCRVMDAATARLLRHLYRDIKKRKKKEAQGRVYETSDPR